MTSLRSLLAMALAAVAACATNPATGRRQFMLISEQDEIRLGAQSDRDVRQQMGTYDDAGLQQYVRGVGQRLARASPRPNLPWTYTVVDSPAVNAFALPGGYVYITRGILPFLRDEAELAAVLGHETGHVAARHSAEAYSRQEALGGGLGVLGVIAPKTQPFQGLADVGFGLLFLKNSRENEVEADRLGTGYASSAGWAPGAMPDLLGTLGRLDEATGSSRGVPNWALTHPPAEDRIAKVQDAVAAARAAGGTATNRAEFEQHLGGVVYGDSREKGIVRGREFLHPVLRFALQFPANWDIVNGDQQVSSREGAAGSVAMVLQLSQQPSGTVEQMARTEMAGAGFRETDGERTTVNGLPAFVGVYAGVVNNARVTLRAAHIQTDRQTYLLAGFAPPGDFARVDPAFQAAIQSFRSLDRQEADRVQPNRIEFYVVRPNDTWESLARGAAGGGIKAATLAIMNGSAPGEPPRPGERIRIVAGG